MLQQDWFFTGFKFHQPLHTQEWNVHQLENPYVVQYIQWRNNKHALPNIGTQSVEVRFSSQVLLMLTQDPLVYIYTNQSVEVGDHGKQSNFWAFNSPAFPPVWMSVCLAVWLRRPGAHPLPLPLLLLQPPPPVLLAEEIAKWRLVETVV